MSKLDAIDSRFKKHENMIEEINKKLVGTEGKIGVVNQLVTEQAKLIELLARQINELENRNVDLENRSRRQNLVFYGVDDTNNKETWNESENLIKSICKDKLGVDLKTVQRAHRVGRYNENFKRPIIVNFASYKEKQDILSNAKKFKGSNYSVDQDYSPKTREIRKKLWEYAKTKKADSGNRVKLNFDKLIVNDKVFTWDTEIEQVVPVKKD